MASSTYYYVNNNNDDGYIYSTSGYNNNNSVQYLGYSAGNGSHNGFYRIPSFNVPKGAVITFAIVRATFYCVTGENPNLKIYAEDADNPSAVSSYADYNSRALTSASLDWDLTFTTTENATKDSGDIKAIIQEVIDRDGWAEGNAIQIFLKNDNSSYVTRTAAFENSSYIQLRVYVEYTYDVSESFPVSYAYGQAKAPTIDSNVNLNFDVATASAEVKNFNIYIKYTFDVATASAEVKNFNVDFTNYHITFLTPAMAHGYAISIVKLDFSPAIGHAFLPNVVVNIGYEPNGIIIKPDYSTEIFHNDRYETYKYELLRLTNGKYKSIMYITNYVENGSININFDRDVIGTAKFNVNDDLELNPLTDLIRPYYVLNNEYEFALGTYTLLTPNRQKDENDYIKREIDGYDLLFALEQDKIITTLNYSYGETVTDLIKDILDNLGTWVEYDIPDSSETLATNIVFELGTSKLEIVNKLLGMINYYPLWCTGKGIYVSRIWDENLNIVEEFIDDDISIYEPTPLQNLDYTEMYNRVIVICNKLDQDTPPLYKVWSFEDEGLEAHPFSYTSIGRYITKKFQIEATSQDSVDAIARNELLKMLEIEETIKYDHMFVSGRVEDGLPWQGDGYRFKNEILNIDSIYRIISHNFKLEVGECVESNISRRRATY